MVLGVSTAVPEREMLIPLIFGVVLFSLVGQGLTIEAFVEKLGLSRTKSDLTEYQSLLGESMSIQMAVEELERNVRQGAISQSACNQMAQRLTLRRQKIEGNIANLQMSDEKTAAEEMQKAERIVLLAQKTALQSAARNGVMELSVVANLISKLEEEQEKNKDHLRDS